jgi:hypothetical protein
MKSISLITIAFAVSTLLFAQNTNAASTDTAFDGTWSVTVNFHEYKNPDGSTARAWVKNLSAKVKNGVLHGELGTRGAPDWYELDGKIEADGTAILRTTGFTGNPAYTGATGHPRSGIPYEYQVIAHFDGRHGTGKSVGNPPRVRIFTFVKD